MKERCNLCGNEEYDLVYEGKIRSAGVDSKFVEGFKILECKSCKINVLSPFPNNLKEFYESEEYRNHYDHTTNEKELTSKYDFEQNDRINKIGIENLRGKVVADYGCGVGLFLDVIKGVTKKTIAVEPMEACARILKNKGHVYYEYPVNVEEDSLDIAVSFDALEHIDKPLNLLKSVYNSLKTDGILYISIPNKNDILMNVHNKYFREFFYCKAHLYYYDIKILSYVIEKSGFRIVEESGIHKYDFSNFISWLKTDKPSGRNKLSFVDSFFESGFNNELIRMNMSSHLFIKAQKQ